MAFRESTYDNLAKGWIELLKERDEEYNEKNMDILSFGMIPMVQFDILMDQIFLKIAEEYTKPGMHFSGHDPEIMVQSFKPEFKQKVEREMSLAIYRNAEMVV
jgi:hypothetical protein